MVWVPIGLFAAPDTLSTMNSLPKWLASFAAIIAALSLAWIAQALTNNPGHIVSVSIYHTGEITNYRGIGIP
jgi:hypothetical protein